MRNPSAANLKTLGASAGETGEARSRCQGASQRASLAREPGSLVAAHCTVSLLSFTAFCSVQDVNSGSPVFLTYATDNVVLSGIECFQQYELQTRHRMYVRGVFLYVLLSRIRYLAPDPSRWVMSDDRNTLQVGLTLPRVFCFLGRRGMLPADHQR